jgi:hypothetical protein
MVVALRGQFVPQFPGDTPEQQTWAQVLTILFDQE